MTVIPALFRYRSDCHSEQGQAERCAQEWTQYALMLFAASAFFSATFLAPYLSHKHGKTQMLKRFLLAGMTYGGIALLLAAVNSKSKAMNYLWIFSGAVFGGVWGGVLLLKQVLLADCIDYGEIVFGAR